MKAKFRVATINVLGASHTSKPGSPYASGPARVAPLVELLESRDIHVAGLQEFQPEQRAEFDRKATGWSRWPGGTKWSTGTTSVVWRDDRWTFVEGRLLALPFYDQTRMSPYVLLEHKKKGLRVWVSTFHNPADTAKFPDQQANRVRASKQQADLVRNLARTGAPHVLTGDMNERGSYFCRLTGMVRVKSPAGGSRSARCRPPAGQAIDWIFSSRALTWSKYKVDRDALVRRTTDHAVRYGTVAMSSADFPGSLPPGR